MANCCLLPRPLSGLTAPCALQLSRCSRQGLPLPALCPGQPQRSWLSRQQQQQQQALHAARPVALYVPQLQPDRRQWKLQHPHPPADSRSAAPPASAVCRAAASSQTFSDGDRSGSSSRAGNNHGVFLAAASLAEGLADTAADLQDLLKRFLSLWRQFLPMLSLFFCLSFINTILDSLKDTLVITAVGGGAFVIPYLTVYAVLPLSMVFLVAFSAASQRMSRSALFNAIVATFVAFFGVFALFLYPNADVLHPHALADQLQQLLPQGLAGLVGMLRNWTFTLFFCMSELWGDVCMGLLFWGLANEITNLSDAATLYPLFGLGANLAQALAGMVLKATTRGGATEFGTALQASMAAVVCIACVAIVLQQHITNQAEAAAAAQRQRHLHRHNSSNMSSAADISRSASPSSLTGAAAGVTGVAAHVPLATPSVTPQPQQQQQQQQQEGEVEKQKKPQSSLRASFKVLAASVEIRCLAVMSLAQGLCNSLMEFAWKCHMRLLYPSPADFTAFLGDVATWSGVVTGGLMLLSPLLFERLGWRGVANATPRILLYGGSAFFLACIVYQHLFGHTVAAAGASAAGPAGVALLQGLVIFGALLYVFGKGAKFSLFKPAEEMVYITLDEDGRTRGKAAIDVVGAQTGKSGGSLLQQALLITSAGSIVGIMPVLFAVFFAMLRGWSSAVYTLSNVRHYSYDSPISSLDEDDGDAPQPGSSSIARVAAAAGGGGSSSGGVQTAQQQELLEKLQGLADGAAVVGTAPSQGSKAYQAAIARSGTTSHGAGSSTGGIGLEATSAADPESPSSEQHFDATSLNGVESRADRAGQQQQQQGVEVSSVECVTLSHDAAQAFRKSGRASARAGAHSSRPAPNDSKGSATDRSSDSSTDGAGSRVSQSGSGGNA